MAGMFRKSLLLAAGRAGARARWPALRPISRRHGAVRPSLTPPRRSTALERARRRFPHIPYYAIGCTLQDIQSRSHGRMKVQVIGKSATGRDMYGVVINRVRTRQEKRDYLGWLGVRALMLREPIAAQKRLGRLGATSRCRCSSRAGSTATSTRASTRRSATIEKYATTPYGDRPGRSTRSSATRSSSSTRSRTRTAGSRARAPTATGSTSTATTSRSRSRRRSRRSAG